ncbi:mechanosensitive ion channel family protein [Nanoarchaeota archaeon]
MINELLNRAEYYFPYLTNKYFISLLILIGAIVGAKLILFVFEKYLQKFAKKTKTEIDDLIFERTKKPLFYFILVYGIKLSLTNLGIGGWITGIVNSLIALVFVFIVARAVDVIIEVWGNTFTKKTQSKLDDVLLPLFHKASKVIFVIIAILWVLSLWKINITPYLAGAGIIGLVLGFALQDSLKNILGGVSLALDNNFNIGDAVRLETGELGTIKDLGLRSTKMLTYDNEVIFIPNGQLANMRIHNYIKPNARVRKIVDFSVEYGSNTEKVKKIVLNTLKKIKDIYDDPYMDVIMIEMADSGLKFQARFWADWDNAYSKFVEATEKIYEDLGKSGIGIPFPTRTVYLKK